MTKDYFFLAFSLSTVPSLPKTRYDCSLLFVYLLTVVSIYLVGRVLVAQVGGGQSIRYTCRDGKEVGSRIFNHSIPTVGVIPSQGCILTYYLHTTSAAGSGRVLVGYYLDFNQPRIPDSLIHIFQGRNPDHQLHNVNQNSNLSRHYIFHRHWRKADIYQ